MTASGRNHLPSVDLLDSRELPNYGISEASTHLRIPRSTLRAWMVGQKGFKPLLDLPQRQPPSLSFFNLVEAHVLDAIRARKVSLQAVRRALAYVTRDLGVPRPLINARFETDGINLFVEQCGKLLDVSSKGQVAMRAILREYLHRIEFDGAGIAAKLYPITGDIDLDDRRPVVFDPRISFGRLIVAGTGITTDAIANRFDGGESLGHIARDFGLDLRQVKDALAWEKRAA